MVKKDSPGVLDRLFAPDSVFQKRFFFFARRFVPGETIESAVATVRGLNQLGMTASLDFLGEDVRDSKAAIETTDTYIRILDVLAQTGADSNVSVKLTAIGLLLDEDFALENLLRIADRASRNPDPFVRIDMEGSAVTQATLRVFERAFATHRNVGIVLQAYLKRTAADVERAIELGARVRLCKGAYSEPPEIAYERMPEIRENFLRLARELLRRGTYPGIATHDRRLIAAVKDVRFRRGHRDATRSSFKCYTAAARTFSASWWRKAIGCAFTYRSERTGRAISTAASSNGVRTRLFALSSVFSR